MSNLDLIKSLDGLARMFGKDRLVTPEEIEKVLSGILLIISEAKKETQLLNSETKKTTEKLLEKILDKYEVFSEDMKTLKGDVTSEQKELVNKVNKKISEVTYLLEEAKKLNVKEEKLEIDDIIQAVMENITLPEVQEMMEISGERIIDLINETEDTEANKISWGKIKDIPEYFTTPQTKKGKLKEGGMSPTVLRQAVDLDHSTRADGYGIVWSEALQKHIYSATGGGGGSGTVNSGTQYRLAYYATTGTAVSQAAAITAARVLISDTNGVPTHSTISTTTLGYLDATSSIQTQLNAKQATITTGTTSQYFRGDLSLATFPTALSSFTNDSNFITASALTGYAVVSGTLAQFAATTSAQLAGVISDETGSGALVFGTDPTFVTRINTPEVKATSSAGIDLRNSTGTQVALFGAGGTNGVSLLGTTNIGSASADYIQIAGNTGSTTQTAAGSSSNININLVPKGTGRLQANAVNVPTVSSVDIFTNKIMSHTVEPSTDDTYTGENVTGFNATATIAQWELVYLSTTGWALADADAESTSGGVMLALASAAGTTSNPLTVVTKGVIRNDGWTWTAAGKPLYVSTTAGALTETAPSGVDDVIRVVGYTLSDDSIYLDPSNDWIVHT